MHRETELTRLRQPADETLLAEANEHAAAKGWRGVPPLTAQMFTGRKTGRTALIVKRGPAFFAAMEDRTAGPASTKLAAFNAVLPATTR